MNPAEAIKPPAVDPRDVAILRAYLYTYVADRLGRAVPVESRVMAHDALDRLAGGDA